MSFLDGFTTRAMGLRYPKTIESKHAPNGSLATVNFQSATEPMYETYSSEAAIQRAYEANVYVYRCVEAISNSIVGCPWRAGDAITNEYRLTHPMARLLGPAPGSPNPNMTSATLLRHAVSSYMLLGKFAWAIERDSANKVIGLWPLRAQHIRPVPSISGPGYFSSFHYGYQGQQGYREFKPNEIVYIWKPSLRDFREAESAVNVAALNINVAKMLDTFDFNFLKNGAVPSNMVVTPPFATDDDRDRFRMQFEADFGGVSNAGKTIFSERTIEGEGPLGGQETVDVKILGLSQRDAQLSVLSDKEISAITIAFGVPLSILGDSSHRTFSNAFQDRRNYWLETLLPKSREIQDGINVNLAPLLDPGGKTVGWFDTSGVPELRGDPAIPDMQAVSWRDAGLVTEDEIRADRGLPPGKDVGLDKVWAQLAADKEQAKKTMTQNAASSVAKQAGGQVVAPAKAPAASAPAASRSLPTSALESVLAGSVRNLLAEVQTVVAQRSESRRSHRPAFDVPFWEARAVSALSPVLVEMGLTTSQVETLAKLITKDTEQHYLTGLDADITVFCAARFVEEATAVPVVEVRQALVDIYLGSSTVEVALAGIGATP